MRYAKRAIAVFWGALALDRAHDDLGRELTTWDEAIYYNAAENVLQGRWLLPLHSATQHPLGVVDPFLHKPPLTYWLFAAPMELFGQSPRGQRVRAFPERATSRPGEVHTETLRSLIQIPGAALRLTSFDRRAGGGI